MTPYAIRRTDKNQQKIVDALRDIGASVLPLHTVGHGCPDLAVGFRGDTYFLEVKSGKGKLTEAERAFFAQWRGRAAVVRSVDDALRAIGAME
jgi:hypothetical protein